MNKNIKPIDVLVIGSGLSSLVFLHSYLKKKKKVEVISPDLNYKKLKKSDLAKHITKILPPQMIGADEKVNYTLNTEVEYVNAQYVIPVGLILNELISNSLKHGFEGEGNISFTYFLKGGKVIFDYRDDGKGFNADQITANFGLELIELLVEQMDGEMKVTSTEGRGVHYVISLPDIKN